MKASDLKLGAVLQFEEDLGVITFKNNRFLLIDADAMGLLRREVIGVLGPDMARRLLVRYGYACGYSDCLRLRQDYDWDTEEEWMMAGPMMHMLEGIVHVRPNRLEYSRSGDSFYMQGDWVNSFEAEQHIKHLGQADNPTCWTLTGYACGYGTAFFNQQIICIERECVGKGDPVCSWQLGRPHQLGFEAQQVVRDLQGFNLAGTINMLEEQIAARTLELSAINAVSIVLAESLALDELLDKALPHVLKATGATFGRIFLLDETGEKLELRVQTEPDLSGLGAEPSQLYVGLPVIENQEWKRLKAGNLVVSQQMSGALFLPELSRRHNWRSLVKVPLTTRGEVAGVLELASLNPTWPATAEEKRLLLSLGRQIGMALGNARLYEQEQQRARAWQGLVEISHKVASSLDKQQTLQSLVEFACELLHSEVAFVTLFSQDEQTLEMTATTGSRTKSLRQLRLPRHLGLTETILHSGQPVIVPDYSTDPRLKGQPTREVLAEGIVSLLVVPLIARNRMLGALYVGERRSRRYTEADADLLMALATQAAIAVEKANLHEREINRIKEVERLKTDFLAMVAHELRTPLTSIKGISSSLLRPDVTWSQPQQDTFLAALDREADVLAGMVSDLLDMSRLEAGAWTIYPEECTFGEILHELQRKLVGVLQERSLNIEYEPALPRLLADQGQIVRVLLNLVTNALKYSGEGQIYLGAYPCDDRWVEVRVGDSGPGIPAEDRPYIFDKFYRSSRMSPGMHNKPGAGLGLAIVKGIVETHGGKVWLAERGTLANSSHQKPGATFCFTLPVAPPKPD